MMNRTNRMSFFDRTLKMWSGYVIVSVYCLETEEKSLIHYIRRKKYPTRLHIILYVVENTEWNAAIYPMNILRNEAIKRVKTTHYLMLDMDEWIIDSLESEIASIPSSIMNQDNAAIVIPLIMLNTFLIKKYCCSFQECVRL